MATIEPHKPSGVRQVITDADDCINLLVDREEPGAFEERYAYFAGLLHADGQSRGLSDLDR